MMFNVLLAILSVSAPGAAALPLLDGVLASVASMTGTHISGSGVLGPNGALAATVDAAGNTVAVRGAIAGTVGAVTGTVGALTGTVSSVVGSVPALCESTLASPLVTPCRC